MPRNHEMNRRILKWDSSEIESSGDPAINIQDTVFGFLDQESEASSIGSGSDNGSRDHEVDEDDDNEERENNSENFGDKNFWESQNQQLQATLYRTSSVETRIRNITKEAVKEAQEAGNVICKCGRALNTNGCKSCLMKEICGRLQNAGFNSAICKSKWRSTPDIPSGEHTFLDVIDESNSKKQQVRVIIELNFRAEFEMARGSEEYNHLIKRLPEVYVGKIERLLPLTKILCTAAKKCMKEKKMHLAPWRKHRYMEAKWLKTRERIASSNPLSSTTAAVYPSRPARPRASMLTVDLLENLPGLRRTAVEVV